MEFQNPYWTQKVKIELLSRWILVHSYLYYELNSSLVSDHKFDDNCRQLSELIETYPEDFKQSRYYYAMYDFDGSTGYGLYYRLKSEHYSFVSRDAIMLKDNPPKNPFAN